MDHKLTTNTNWNTLNPSSGDNIYLNGFALNLVGGTGIHSNQFNLGSGTISATSNGTTLTTGTITLDSGFVSLDGSLTANLKAGTNNLLTVTSSAMYISIVGNITGGNTGIGVNVSGGNVNISGTVNGGSVSGAYGVSISSGTATITNINSVDLAVGCYQTGGTLTVTGTITGGAGCVCRTAVSALLINGSGATTNLTGTTIIGGSGDNSYGVQVTTVSSFNLANVTISGGSGMSSHGIYYTQSSFYCNANSINPILSITGGSGNSSNGFYISSTTSNPAIQYILYITTCQGGTGIKSTGLCFSGELARSVNPIVITNCIGGSNHQSHGCSINTANNLKIEILNAIGGTNISAFGFYNQSSGGTISIANSTNNTGLAYCAKTTITVISGTNPNNWSTLKNGGYPSAGDEIIVGLGNAILTLDGDDGGIYTCSSITANNVNGPGGSIAFGAGVTNVTINADLSNGINLTPLLTIATQTVTINGNITGGSVAGPAGTILKTGTGTIVVNGMIIGGSSTPGISLTTATASGAGIDLTVNNPGSTALLAGSVSAINIGFATQKVNINGNIVSVAAVNGLTVGVASTINVTGNVVGGTTGIGLSVIAAATVSVAGNITGGSTSGHGASVTAGATFTVAGRGSGCTAIITVDGNGAITGATSFPVKGSLYPPSSIVYLNITGGSGAGVIAVNTDSSGVVSSYNSIINGGTGYTADTFATTARGNITGGSSSGSGLSINSASAVINLTNSNIYGGSGATAYGVGVTAISSLDLTGAVIVGGSGSTAYGIYYNSATKWTGLIASSTGGTVPSAAGLYINSALATDATITTAQGNTTSATGASGVYVSTAFATTLSITNCYGGGSASAFGCESWTEAAAGSTFTVTNAKGGTIAGSYGFYNHGTSTVNISTPDETGSAASYYSHYLIVSGSAVWSTCKAGGLPGATDIIKITSGSTLELNSNEGTYTCASINGPGTLTFGGGVSTVTIVANLLPTITASMLVVTSQTVNITGNIIGGSATGICAITNTNGTIIVTSGNVTGGSAGTACGILKTGTGTIVVNGTVTGGTNSTAYGINLTTAAAGGSTVDLTVNNIGNTAVMSGTSVAINPAIASIIHINGNIVATTATGLSVTTGCTVTIVGNITGSSTTSSTVGLIANFASALIKLNGIITGGSFTNSYGANIGTSATLIPTDDGTITVNAGSGAIGLNATTSTVVVTNIYGIGTRGGAAITLSNFTCSGIIQGGTTGAGLTITSVSAVVNLTNAIITGGSGTSGYGVTVTSIASLNLNGTVITGGNGTTAHGIYYASAAKWTGTITSVTGGNNITAAGLWLNANLLTGTNPTITTAQGGETSTGGPGVYQAATTFSNTLSIGNCYGGGSTSAFGCIALTTAGATFTITKAKGGTVTGAYGFLNRSGSLVLDSGITISDKDGSGTALYYHSYLRLTSATNPNNWSVVNPSSTADIIIASGLLTLDTDGGTYTCASINGPGTLAFGSGVNTVTIVANLLPTTTASMLAVTAQTVNITGNIIGGSASNICAITNTNGTIVVTGNVTGGSAADACGILKTGTGTITVNGMIIGGGNSRGVAMTHAAATGNAVDLTVYNPGNTALLSGAMTTIGIQFTGQKVNITGNIVSAGSVALTVGAGSTTNITGNITGGATGSGLSITDSDATVTINGNITGGPVVNGNGINIGNGIVNLNGVITGGIGAYGCYMNGGTLQPTTPGGVITINAGTAYGLYLTGSGTPTIIVTNIYGVGTTSGAFVSSGSPILTCTGIIQGGTTAAGLSYSSGTITLNGVITGGSDTNGYGVASASPATLTNAVIIGGSGSAAHGIYYTSATQWTGVITSATGGPNITAAGLYLMTTTGGTITTAQGGLTSTGGPGVHQASTSFVNTLNITNCYGGGSTSAFGCVAYAQNAGVFNIGAAKGGSVTGAYGFLNNGYSNTISISNLDYSNLAIPLGFATNYQFPTNCFINVQDVSGNPLNIYGIDNFPIASNVRRDAVYAVSNVGTLNPNFSN